MDIVTFVVTFSLSPYRLTISLLLDQNIPHFFRPKEGLLRPVFLGPRLPLWEWVTFIAITIIGISENGKTDSAGVHTLYLDGDDEAETETTHRTIDILVS